MFNSITVAFFLTFKEKDGKDTTIHIEKNLRCGLFHSEKKTPSCVYS